MFLDLVFILIAALLFYVYAGYPLILYIAGLFAKRQIKKSDFFPFVSVIIAAYNEESNIENKINDTLALDYPPEKLEIIIASDGSTDRTNEIVRRFSAVGVRLLDYPERKGKTYVQNKAAGEARGEILLFSDATTVYKPDLIKNIAAYFADNSVGAAGGELEYLNKNQGAVGEGSGAYWKYEKFLKKMESKISSLIGVSGCCYAVRKSLYEPIDSDIISDFVVAQLIYKKNKRVVYAADAVSYEYSSLNMNSEFGMRVRIAVRTLNGIFRMKSLLNPLKYGFYSIQIISHKFLRYLVPPLLLCLLAVNITLVARAPASIYSAFLILQAFFYACAVVGGLTGSKAKMFSVPWYFCATNTAIFAGMLKFIKGEKKVLWNPLR